MRKKNILFSNEFSELATGFSGIGKEIISYLYNTNKYNIIELASYVSPTDPRILNVPWPVIAAMPHPKDQAANQLYHQNIYAQFGAMHLEKALLDNKIDILINIRDVWMSSEFELKSPFRKYFKYLYMPTIDGNPQKEAWIEDYKESDCILAYSRFGKESIEAVSDVKVFDIARPCVNTNIFKPLNKKELRKKYDIPENAQIIISTMRNQKRKLFPDLIESFNEYLKLCVKNGNEELAKNSYLYLHTALIDVGFDIGWHILKNNLSHKVLLTYSCQVCGGVFPDFYKEEVGCCKNCRNVSAVTPGTGNGVSQHKLCEIYNLADLYVQYSICEGMGMPPAEAKACGLMALVTDYSAMSEQGECYGTDKIKVQRFNWEGAMETSQARAMPDNTDCAKKIYKMLLNDEKTRRFMAESVRKDVVENYSFERAAKIFEKAIDSIECPDHSETWDNPKLNLCPINRNIPQFQSNHQLIDWAIVNILGQSEKLNTYWRHSLVKDLSMNFRFLPGGGRTKFGPNECLEYFYKLAENHNFWELERFKRLKKQEEVINFDLV